MKKYLLIFVLAITLATTGIAMAGTGEMSKDLIIKLLHFLRADVDQLQTKTEEIQNQVNEIPTKTTVQVYDATGKEIGLLMDQALTGQPTIFDININKLYQIDFYKGNILHFWDTGLFLYETDDCTGDTMIFMNWTPNSYSIGKDLNGNYYETTDSKRNITTNSYSWVNNGVPTCVKDNQYVNDFYIVKPFTLPSYQVPLRYEVR